jgi:hypothetical protein
MRARNVGSIGLVAEVGHYVMEVGDEVRGLCITCVRMYMRVHISTVFVFTVAPAPDPCFGLCACFCVCLHVVQYV